MRNKQTRIDSSLLNYIHTNKQQSFFQEFLHENNLINSFECDNDSIIGAGDYSFLIYNSQYLILYNIDGPIEKISWDTNIQDSIIQIQYSSYHRGYLIMTARLISLFNLSSYRIQPLKSPSNLNEYFQLLTCHENDFWIVCLLNSKRKQVLIHYDFHSWKGTYLSLEKLSLYPTDRICALETNQNGDILALLIAERNQNLTVGMQRRRRLVFISTSTCSPSRIIYFSGADDLYWTLTSISYPRQGWLLTKYFNNEITYVDHQLDVIQYRKSLRNLVLTHDGHYLIVRTINSLDIYQLY